MSRVPLELGRLLIPTLLCLLLCGILSAELPELLSLTDNTANDFTVHNSNNLVSRANSHPRRPVRIADINSSTSASVPPFSCLRPVEIAAWLGNGLPIIHPVLRT
jgi:hypothetical protein